jgi:hypothetical protein
VKRRRTPAPAGAGAARRRFQRRGGADPNTGVKPGTLHKNGHLADTVIDGSGQSFGLPQGDCAGASVPPCRTRWC